MRGGEGGWVVRGGGAGVLLRAAEDRALGRSRHHVAPIGPAVASGLSVMVLISNQDSNQVAIVVQKVASCTIRR